MYIIQIIAIMANSINEAVMLHESYKCMRGPYKVKNNIKT